MTALPGGASDKAGNIYEHLWTAMRVADLLHGDASRLRLEPPGFTGVGIEFEIDVAGSTWGEQAKHSAKTWTINRLGAEGVLTAAKHQIGLGRRFRLVASSTAVVLSTLSDRARATDNLAEFEGTLGAKWLSGFEDLLDHWGVTADEAWRLLKEVYVEQHTRESLARNVRLAYRTLYADDPDIVVAAVRSFCDDHIHETVTAPQVAAHLRREGFRTRLLAHDDDTRRRLHRTIERHQRRVQRTAPAFGLVGRDEVDEIVAGLEDRMAPQLLIVDAPAGYGKSTVVADVTATLERKGWFVAAARMDVDTATPTSEQLGNQMGLGESPTVLLAGVADGSPALLLVDQLDAVSLFSGRMPDSFDAVDDVLGEIQQSPNVKVLLVCRTVDLDNDPRLQSLLRADRAAGRHTLGKLAADRVQQHLAAHGVRVPADETIELLGIPLHLAIYGRLSDEARQLPYRTVQDLYDQLTREVRSRAEHRATHLDWRGVTSALVNYMSEHETLTVPRTVLDGFRVDDIGALESEAVLVGDDAGLAFFHESYFDYLFARAFVHAGRDLHAFLADSGQYLFRRAQTRQVLEHLAATDREAFHVTVAKLVASEEIRSHLKRTALGVLQKITPTAEEWAAIEDVAWADVPIARSLLNLLSDPGWFDAADDLGRWEQWLADDSRVEHVTDQLIFAARQRAERVAELVRPHVGTSEDWRLRLRALVSWSLTPDLVPLAVELIQGGRIDDARGPIAVNSDFWSIVYGLHDDDPCGAARVIGAFLRRGIARALTDGSPDPFESGHLEISSPSGGVIRKVAVKAPDTLVDEVLPFVIKVALAGQRTRRGRLPAGKRWGYRHRGSEHGVDAIVFVSIEEALLRLATEDPARTVTAITELRHIDSEELRFLACRTLTALNDSDEAVGWLLDDTRNLVLGWADSPHWATRELIERHSPHCTDDLYTQLEDAILCYRSPWERAAVGHGQYTLLSTLDPTRMSADARRRLNELRRRFSHPPPKPQPIVVSNVGSPIADDASKRMGDNNWLAALHKHDVEQTDWRGEVPLGGARELAQVLGERAKEEPERFARLALRFDASIPVVAAEQVIRNIRSGVDANLLTDVCDRAAELYGEAVGRAICSAAQSVADFNPRLVALIERYAKASDPDCEWARTDAGGDTDYSRGDVYLAGVDSTRGQAALAAASVLFAGTDHVDTLTPVVASLAVDSNTGVRACAAESVVALLKHDTDIALDLAERLLDVPTDVYDAPTIERLLTYCLLRAPKRFAPHLKRALDGSHAVAVRAGRSWAVVRYRAKLDQSVTAEVSALPTPARIGVAEVWARNIAECAREIGDLFDDPDTKVRETAAGGFRNLSDLAADDLEPLIQRFNNSAAFADQMDVLIGALEKLGTRLPPATLRVCVLAVNAGGRDLGDIRSARSLVGQDLIAVVLRLYRQGGPKTRAKCLDVIDRLIEVNAHDIEKALAEER